MCFLQPHLLQVMTNPSNTNGALGDVKQAIEASFGSVDEMQKKFNAAAAARFGSGWAWLGVKSDGTLAITSTPNQDNPLMEPAGGKQPSLFVLIKRSTVFRCCTVCMLRV